MVLTREPIETILRTKAAVHNDIGQKFIDAVFEKTEIRVIASYIQTGTELVIAPNQKIETLIRKNQLQFVRSSLLTVWCHSDGFDFRAVDDMKTVLYDIFCETLNKEHIELEYPRVYVPEEIHYYGWINKKREAGDISNIIALNDNLSEKHAVNIEFIDHLALWHAIEGSLRALNRQPCLADIGARVFCGYDENRRNMAYYVVLPNISAGIDREALSRAFSSAAMQILKPNDHWNAVNETSVSPIICKWNELSDELKFAFSKG